MKVIDKMIDTVRNQMRGFLRIESAQHNVFQISESLDFNGNVAKNRIWYRGKADELSQLYKMLPGEGTRTRFWAAVPTTGREIEKNHTGLPGIIVDTLVSIVIADMNDVKVEGKSQSVWEEIAKDNKFVKLVEKALTEVLVVGDGTFRISFDPDITEYPILEFISGDRVEFNFNRGRLREVVIHTLYKYKTKEYELQERYGYGYVRSFLFFGGKEVALNTIPDTEKLNPEVLFDPHFMLTVPLKIFESNCYGGRGGSIFDKKTDNFDNLDESWSQWMDALRKARTKEYIPESLLPRNPNTGEALMPNAFDNAYIKHDCPMTEGQMPEISVVQPAIPTESYLGTYMTALDLCLQGLISPSTLGIDVKKLDNADAQREKEKATLYTRNKIVDALQEVIPELVDTTLKAFATYKKEKLEDVKADISWGEYANPSFESQVETVVKARGGQIMSVEASVEELYGDSKEKTWKEEEVKRLKAEQGIVELVEPSVNTDGVNITGGDMNGSDDREKGLSNGKETVPEISK